LPNQSLRQEKGKAKMSVHSGQDSLTERIMQIAMELGASLVAAVPVSALCAPAPLLSGPDAPTEAVAMLVLALEHPETEPELDWWDGPGGTEGNRRLRAISEQLERHLAAELDIRSRPLPYHPGKGGVLLKDAATLAGLGCIGANNLLITPQYGPRVRLRALVLDQELTFQPMPRYAPCETCPRPCWQACPQQAFASGIYARDRCARQMEADEERARRGYKDANRTLPVDYCRACELACPVGRKTD
jgi:epoxyqueuosine reductase